jgi:hypothetical protein
VQDLTGVSGALAPEAAQGLDLLIAQHGKRDGILARN